MRILNILKISLTVLLLLQSFFSDLSKKRRYIYEFRPSVFLDFFMKKLLQTPKQHGMKKNEMLFSSPLKKKVPEELN